MKSACFDIWIVRGILTRLVPFSYWIIFISKNILWLLPKYWMFFAFWRVSYCIIISTSWPESWILMVWNNISLLVVFRRLPSSVSLPWNLYTNRVLFIVIWSLKTFSLRIMSSILMILIIIFRCKIKIVDFGGSNFTTSSTLSSYIQSRAYRAPEVYFCLFSSF